jgi:hypothetical protein
MGFESKKKSPTTYLSFGHRLLFHITFLGGCLPGLSEDPKHSLGATTGSLSDLTKLSD